MARNDSPRSEPTCEPRGQLISDLDILIAATALQHRLTLLTFNVSDFGRIPDLRLYQAERS